MRFRSSSLLLFVSLSLLGDIPRLMSQVHDENSTEGSAIGKQIKVLADQRSQTVPERRSAVQVRRPGSPLAPDLEAFDNAITDLMKKFDLPGGVVAVAREGKLVIAHSYGLADVEHQIPVHPDSLFRICSISKTITAASIMKFVEEGQLDLETKAFAVLDQLQPPAGQSADPRIFDITIHQLLQHTGGWDRDKSGDPTGQANDIARALGVDAPAKPDDIIRYMMTRPLDFPPGSRMAYSNFGYMILGKIIEKVAGQSYEEHVKSKILAPLGITRMQIGKPHESQLAPGEVHYYDVPGAPLVWTALRGGPPIVSRPYAYFDPQANCASGGWVASAMDLLRFSLAMDEKSGHPLLLQPATLELMRTGSLVSIAPDLNLYYGLGWTVEPAAQSDPMWWHGGSLIGTATCMVRRHDGVHYVAFFNSFPFHKSHFADISMSQERDKTLMAAIDSVTDWPTEDLFAEFQ